MIHGLHCSRELQLIPLQFRGPNFLLITNNIYFQTPMELAVEGLLSMASPQTTAHTMERALVLEQGEHIVLGMVTLAVFLLKLRWKFFQIKLTLTKC